MQWIINYLRQEMNKPLVEILLGTLGSSWCYNLTIYHLLSLLVDLLWKEKDKQYKSFVIKYNMILSIKTEKVDFFQISLFIKRVRMRVMVFEATFNNISVISPILWRSVLLVEETGVPRENHRPVANHWQTLSHNVVSSTPRHEQGSNSQP